MSEQRIRPKAVCVVRRDDEILVGDGWDPTKRERFYGPLGGGVEFGERAADAVRREMREELGVELTDVVLLGVLENIFVYDGCPGHEISFVFEARLADESLYARELLEGDEEGQHFTARWLPVDHFAPGGPPLYPEGLYGLLSAGVR